MKESVTILIVLFLSLFCSSCEKDTNTTPDPKFILSSDTIIFDSREYQPLYLSTNPLSECVYKILSKPNWIETSVDSGVIRNNISEIQLRAHLNFPKIRKHKGELKIMSNLGIGSVVLIAQEPEIETYTYNEYMDFWFFADKRTLTLRNTGNVPITYTLDNDKAFLSLSKKEGRIEKNMQEEISISLDRSLMDEGDYSVTLGLTVNEHEHEVNVRVAKATEYKRMFQEDVVDAEYSKEKDYLVYVSSNSLSLSIYEPDSDVVESVELDYKPLCVSLSKDGKQAVVGHDKHISHVDLESKRVLKTFSISFEAFDIVLANNWAYVYPNYGYYSRFLCVDLSMNVDNEVPHIGSSIGQRRIAKLHPSGKFIYGVTTSSSPSDLEKYDIQERQAKFLYDSPYHGDHSINGNLWFSEDGERIFTCGGSVFRTSESRDQDLIYNGKINVEKPYNYNYNNIECLYHSEVMNNLYLIARGGAREGTNRPYMYIYDANSLQHKQRYELESFYVPDGFGSGDVYTSDPRFIFSNAAGDEIYVLIKATGAGLSKEWAIQKIEL